MGRGSGRRTSEREVLLKRRILGGAVACAALALLAGCGGSHKDATTGSTATPTASNGGVTTRSSSNPKSFANFRVAQNEGIDFLDPGLSYVPQGWFELWNSYLPLIGYRHVNGAAGATLVPYLAQDLPKVPADGKTYKLKLRKGLKYSDGTPVKASDFAATIERDFKLHSPRIGLFSNTKGTAPSAATAPS